MSEEKEEKYTELAQKRVDDIRDALEVIEPNCVTILTGDNATGKSLIRKLIWKYISKKTGKDVRVSDTSMERRTGLHSEFGGLGVMLRDNEMEATSENSLYFIKGVLKSKERYIVIDEPEIGMSETLQKSLAVYLNKRIPEVLENNYGILVITHSKQIVKTLENAVFVNVQKKTKDEWLNAEPEVIDIEQFEKEANDLCNLLRSKMKYTKG